MEHYSPDATLVIDPTEVFCSFDGSKSDNWGYTATYDGAGNLYMGGIVLDETGSRTGGMGMATWQSRGLFRRPSRAGMPVKAAAPGDINTDVGIMKLSANGSNRIFATYLGGSGDEQPHSMIVDTQREPDCDGKDQLG